MTTESEGLQMDESLKQVCTIFSERDLKTYLLTALLHKKSFGIDLEALRNVGLFPISDD